MTKKKISPSKQSAGDVGDDHSEQSSNFYDRGRFRCGLQGPGCVLPLRREANPPAELFTQD